MQPADSLTIAPPSQIRRVWWPWGMIVLAWGVFLITTLTHTAYLLDHHDWLARPNSSPWVVAGVFLGSWYLMLAAMMLPCICPQMQAMRQTPHRVFQAQSAFLGGYLLVWTIFGVVALGIDTGMVWLLTQWDVLALHPWIIGIAFVTLAGLYQLTPAKRHAVHICSCVLHTDGVYRARHAWQDGRRIGRASLRAEWALMLVMFGVGMTSLSWLLALTLIMVVEHLVPWRQRAVSLAGITLLVVAALWLAQATAPDAAVAAVSGSVIQTQEVTGNTIRLQIDPARYGTNTVLVTVHDRQGTPLTGATVSVETTMLDMDMGTQDIPLTPMNMTVSGGYQGHVILSMPGRWELAVTVIPPDGTAAIHATYRFAITAPTA